MSQKNVISRPSHSIQINLNRNKTSASLLDDESLLGKNENSSMDCNINNTTISNDVYNNVSSLAKPSKEVFQEFDTNHNYTQNLPKIEKVHNKLQSNVDETNSRDLKHFKGLNVGFIVKNLNNDRRVRKYEQSGSCIYVYFWSLSGSISFYKQYFYHIDMNFYELKNNISGFEKKDNINVWRLRDLNTLYYESFTYHSQLSLQMKLNNLNGITHPESIKIPPFTERVEELAKLSNFFSSQDVKNFMNLANQQEYNFIFTSTIELCVGITTNVLMQDVLQRISKFELDRVIDILGFDIGPISATKYGAYVIQVMISILSLQESCEKVKTYLNVSIIDLLKHPIGNYTPQKICNFDVVYITKIYEDNFFELLSDELGFKVFKKIFGKLNISDNLFKERFRNYSKKFTKKRHEEVKSIIFKNKNR